MTDLDEDGAERPAVRGVWGTVRARLEGLRSLLAVAAMGALAVASSGGHVLVTLASFASVVIVAAARARPLERVRPRALSRLADDLRLEPAALVEALSDPTFILRRAGTVANLNEAAREIFPRARPGRPRSPSSFALRTCWRRWIASGRAGRSEVARLANRGAGERSFDVESVAAATAASRARDPRPAQGHHGGAADRGACGPISWRMRATSCARPSHLCSASSRRCRVPPRKMPPHENAFSASWRSRPCGCHASSTIFSRSARLRNARMCGLAMSWISGTSWCRSPTAWPPLARELGVAVHLARETEDTTVLGDRDELTRVLENLTENAIKYGRDGERVTLTASRTGSQLSIAVRDHGPGIAPEDLPRLTERFYRVDVAGSRAMGGTGLGLALAKNILLRHGGRLVIASTLGEGATFTAELPLARP